MHSCLVHNAKRKARRPNTLRMDPTRTLHISEQFGNEMKRRFRKLKAHIYEFLVTQDALGLKKSTEIDGFVHNVEPRQYAFLTDPKKREQFNLWLQQQIEQDVFFPELGAGILRTTRPLGRIGTSTGIGFGGSMGTGPWTMKYIESSYKKGLINAYLEPDDPKYIDISQEEFLRESFNTAERISKVELLASRSYEQLRGVTAQMSSQMNTVLAQGMIDGRGVTAIASEMLDKVDGLTSSRALTIARTEVINAHAEGQLDSFEDLGVDELGVMAEWSTAGDDNVCPQCEALEGQTFTVEEARGMIPQHPNCRCTWIPSIP
jgi:SPP1 gp7 family putative phage head morphogenesis protein